MEGGQPSRNPAAPTGAGDKVDAVSATMGGSGGASTPSGDPVQRGDTVAGVDNPAAASTSAAQPATELVESAVALPGSVLDLPEGAAHEVPPQVQAAGAAARAAALLRVPPGGQAEPSMEGILRGGGGGPPPQAARAGSPGTRVHAWQTPRSVDGDESYHTARSTPGGTLGGGAELGGVMGGLGGVVGGFAGMVELRVAELQARGGRPGQESDGRDGRTAHAGRGHAAQGRAGL